MFALLRMIKSLTSISISPVCIFLFIVPSNLFLTIPLILTTYSFLIDSADLKDSSLSGFTTAWQIPFISLTSRKITPP